MADAKVIPFGDEPRSRRGRPKAKGARPARRTTPLAPVPEQQDAPGPERQDAAAPGHRPAAGAPEPARPAGPAPNPTDESEEPAAVAAEDGGWERRLAHGLSFLRRRITGDYEVDEFGYDQDLTDKVLMSLLRPVYEKYFRVEVKGVENIPAEGGALVVCNHSGTLPLDGLMLQVAVHDHHPAGRHLRLLAADLVFVLPVVSELARKAGHTLACAEDAERLLERGEVVGVMPEGFKGIGKPFSERYKLQRFGRGGFVSTALRAGVPIVPCSIVGAEEIYPMLGNARTLARLLGFPYFPLTPTFPWLGPLGAVPLPTKWTIQFGEPIPTDGYPPEAADDPMLMFNLTDQVRETIQHTLYKLLVQRRSVFF
ncbi:1-acyl-sn-glycerol-3-phosphate acyltransferase [Streptomyces sp. URMC 123]|uniref:lysophospholipid acyltransferase family protein n=1 Tax=Streptomyces sp. URMC 123 TaxID=3423403 RepID=UPI003F1E088D